MKKMSKLAVAGLLVLGLTSGAQAADIKATGAWQIDATWSNSNDFVSAGKSSTSTGPAGSGFSSGSKDNDFRIEQRVRTAFQFIANENLKAVLDTQIGTNSWGNGQYQIGAGRTPANNLTNGGSNVAGDSNIMLRKAYLDFKVPNTKINVLAGYQTVNLPAAFGGGSAILDDQVGALVVSSPVVDGVKVLAGYARPFDSNTAGSTASVQGEGTGSNVFFAAVPLDLPGNTQITPFGAYASIGQNAIVKYSDGTGAVYGATSDSGLSSPLSGKTDGAKGWWGGLAMTTTALDSFKIMADFNYGSVDYNSSSSATGKNSSTGRAGWLADFAIDYTGLSFMTPEAFFVYSSGDSSSTSKEGGRMPTLGNPQSWTVGSMFFGNRDWISPSSTNNQAGSYAGYVRNVMGFWTAGVSLKDIKLIDKLSHRVNLLYIQGTNNRDAVNGSGASSTYASYGAYLTTRDSMWEADLNTKYQMYDELALMLDLGYINADLHQYNGQVSNAVFLKDNAYRVTASMVYTF